MEREGEQLLSGYATFGRVTIFFRDLREVKFLGKTTRDDLPDYGRPVEGLDVRVTDRDGVANELIGFRRAVGENILPGARGAASIAIPLRIVKRVEIAADKGSPLLRAVATLKDGSSLEFRLPSYVEETAYRGETEFGIYRIHLGKMRDLVVHRETPALRELEPATTAPDEPDTAGDYLSQGNATGSATRWLHGPRATRPACRTPRTCLRDSAVATSASRCCWPCAIVRTYVRLSRKRSEEAGWTFRKRITGNACAGNWNAPPEAVREAMAG